MGDDASPLGMSWPGGGWFGCGTEKAAVFGCRISGDGWRVVLGSGGGTTPGPGEAPACPAQPMPRRHPQVLGEVGVPVCAKRGN